MKHAKGLNKKIIFTDDTYLPMVIFNNVYVFVFFRLCCAACRILFPQAGTEPVLLQEQLKVFFLKKIFISCCDSFG